MGASAALLGVDCQDCWSALLNAYHLPPVLQPRKHAPIVFQPEAAPAAPAPEAPAAAATPAPAAPAAAKPAAPKPAAAKPAAAAPKQQPKQQAAAPAAAPPQQQQQPTEPATQPTAQEPKQPAADEAVDLDVSVAGCSAACLCILRGSSLVRPCVFCAAAVQRMLPFSSRRALALRKLVCPACQQASHHLLAALGCPSLPQLDFEGLEGGDGMDEVGAADDEDDFEAQMRALEEGL